MHFIDFYSSGRMVSKHLEVQNTRNQFVDDSAMI